MTCIRRHSSDRPCDISHFGAWDSRLPGSYVINHDPKRRPETDDYFYEAEHKTITTGLAIIAWRGLTLLLKHTQAVITDTPAPEHVTERS